MFDLATIQKINEKAVECAKKGRPIGEAIFFATAKGVREFPVAEKVSK
jgi:hypothetical protein